MIDPFNKYMLSSFQYTLTNFLSSDSGTIYIFDSLDDTFVSLIESDASGIYLDSFFSTNSDSQVFGYFTDYQSLKNQTGSTSVLTLDGIDPHQIDIGIEDVWVERDGQYIQPTYQISTESREYEPNSDPILSETELTNVDGAYSYYNPAGYGNYTVDNGGTYNRNGYALSNLFQYDANATIFFNTQPPIDFGVTAPYSYVEQIIGEDISLQEAEGSLVLQNFVEGWMHETTGQQGGMGLQTGAYYQIDLSIGDFDNPNIPSDAYVNFQLNNIYITNASLPSREDYVDINYVDSWDIGYNSLTMSEYRSTYDFNSYDPFYTTVIYLDGDITNIALDFTLDAVDSSYNTYELNYEIHVWQLDVNDGNYFTDLSSTNNSLTSLELPVSDKVFMSTNSDETFSGGEGNDNALFNGALENYTIAISTATDVVTVSDIVGSDGVDTLIDIERLKFTDTHLAIDLDGNAGQAYRIYKAAFDRVPDLGGLGFWINALDNGASLTSMASGFTNSVEFESLYGSNNTNKDFVNLMYNNVLDRDADEGGYDFWLGHMDSGAVSREQLLIDFSESNENQLNVIGLISNGIEYTEWVG